MSFGEELMLAIGICMFAGIMILVFAWRSDNKKKKVCKDFYERGDR